jgi:N-methylhydantoinase A
VDKIVKAVADAAHQHELGSDVPLVALGGAGEALVPLVAERLGRPVIRPEHPEVLSSIGAAVSLVRAEVTRSSTTDGAAVELAREAERACVASGAAPATVTVETAFDERENVLRAVATGAVALEVGAADREPAGDETRLRAAADALGLAPAELQLVAETGFYQVYSENGSGRVAAVDGLGAVALAEDARRVLTAKGPELVGALLREVEAATRNLGVATLLPRVSLVCGSRILDLSDARRPEDVAAAAARSLEGQSGTAVAVVSR